jgi:hypothetical protein
MLNLIASICIHVVLSSSIQLSVLKWQALHRTYQCLSLGHLGWVQAWLAYARTLWTCHLRGSSAGRWSSGRNRSSDWALHVAGFKCWRRRWRRNEGHVWYIRITMSLMGRFFFFALLCILWILSLTNMSPCPKFRLVHSQRKPVAMQSLIETGKLGLRYTQEKVAK